MTQLKEILEAYRNKQREFPSYGELMALADQKHPADFAKIVRGTSGQQVMFYLEDSDDDPNTLHCVANYGGIQADVKLGNLPDVAFSAALGKADLKMADKVLAQLAGLGLSSDAAAQGA